MPAKILIVEDEAIVAMDISYQLTEMGYQVCAIADNGATAIGLVEQHRPDIVLMDIVLKGSMDGVETAKHVSHRFQTPVIFLTAYSDSHTIMRAAQTAPYGYLTKPFQANELRAVIEVALYKAGMETRLRESERWFSATLRCVADAVIATDEEERVKFMNPQAEEALGWNMEEILGRKISEVLVLQNARTHAAEDNPLTRALQGNMVIGIEFGTLLVSRNGQQFPIDDSAAPIRDDNGHVLGAVMAFRNVGDRVELERELRQREEHFRKAFDFAPGGMALISMDGAFLQTNEALCAMLGYTHEELLNHSHADLTFPADITSEKTLLTDLLAGENPSVQFEKRYVRKNGETLWVLASVSLLMQGEMPMCYLYQIHNLTERKHSEYQLSRLAHFDTLTGLANRARLAEEADDQILIAKRQASGLAVVFMDVDHFKQVNDSLGHEAGDQLLQEVGARLKAAVRETDCVSRFGGDEFVLLLPNITSPEDVSAVTSKILSEIARPIALGAQSVSIGASMGVSLYPEDGTDTKTLLRCADSALYHAKEQGRHNVQFYRKSLTERIEQRFQLEKELRAAIEREEFELYYQPIVSLDKQRLHLGAEALIRWHHPKRGLLLPDQFIPLAEESGLILPIGRWVIGAAFRQAALWQKEIPREQAITLSINISAKQFREADLLPFIRQTLAETDANPALLCLEITEQILLHDTEQNLRVLSEIKAMGITIAIDDFGVGYSSLSYLKRFGPTQLKVDRSFLRDVPENSEDAVIVKAIVAMAKSLKVQVVAEGIETQAQRDFIAAEGCDMAQGFFYATPCTADQFRQTWLDNCSISA